MIDKKHLFLVIVLSFVVICVILVSCDMIMYNSKTVSYQTNYWDFYSPLSYIYIKDMVRSGNGSIVSLYPQGTIEFYFEEDGIVKKEIGSHFIECTRSGNGEYITITDTDIPFLPKANPLIWVLPIGNDNDFETMKELFKTPRDGACYTQVDFMVKLAQEHGVIARRINLWQYPKDGMLTAGGHTTMEIYDRNTKQWVWMDPLYNIVEAKVGNKTLTLYELYMDVNSGYDITLIDVNGREIRFDKWEHSKIWRNYMNPSQMITYVIP